MASPWEWQVVIVSWLTKGFSIRPEASPARWVVDERTATGDRRYGINP
jgi:hypothetical protein